MLYLVWVRNQSSKNKLEVWVKLKEMSKYAMFAESKPCLQLIKYNKQCADFPHLCQRISAEEAVSAPDRKSKSNVYKVCVFLIAQRLWRFWRKTWQWLHILAAKSRSFDIHACVPVCCLSLLFSTTFCIFQFLKIVQPALVLLWPEPKLE